MDDSRFLTISGHTTADYSWISPNHLSQIRGLFRRFLYSYINGKFLMSCRGDSGFKPSKVSINETIDSYADLDLFYEACPPSSWPLNVQNQLIERKKQFSKSISKPQLNSVLFTHQKASKELPAHLLEVPIISRLPEFAADAASSILNMSMRSSNSMHQSSKLSGISASLYDQEDIRFRPLVNLLPANTPAWVEDLVNRVNQLLLYHQKTLGKFGIIQQNSLFHVDKEERFFEQLPCLSAAGSLRVSTSNSSATRMRRNAHICSHKSIRTSQVSSDSDLIRCRIEKLSNDSLSRIESSVADSSQREMYLSNRILNDPILQQLLVDEEEEQDRYNIIESNDEDGNIITSKTEAAWFERLARKVARSLRKSLASVEVRTKAAAANLSQTFIHYIDELLKLELEHDVVQPSKRAYRRASTAIISHANSCRTRLHHLQQDLQDRISNINFDEYREKLESSIAKGREFCLEAQSESVKFTKELYERSHDELCELCNQPINYNQISESGHYEGAISSIDEVNSLINTWDSDAFSESAESAEQQNSPSRVPCLLPQPNHELESPIARANSLRFSKPCVATVPNRVPAALSIPIPSSLGDIDVLPIAIDEKFPYLGDFTSPLTEEAKHLLEVFGDVLVGVETPMSLLEKIRIEAENLEREEARISNALDVLSAAIAERSEKEFRKMISVEGHHDDPFSPEALHALFQAVSGAIVSSIAAAYLHASGITQIPYCDSCQTSQISRLSVSLRSFPSSSVRFSSPLDGDSVSFTTRLASNYAESQPPSMSSLDTEARSESQIGLIASFLLCKRGTKTVMSTSVSSASTDVSSSARDAANHTRRVLLVDLPSEDAHLSQNETESEEKGWWAMESTVPGFYLSADNIDKFIEDKVVEEGKAENQKTDKNEGNELRPVILSSGANPTRTGVLPAAISHACLGLVFSGVGAQSSSNMLSKTSPWVVLRFSDPAERLMFIVGLRLLQALIRTNAWNIKNRQLSLVTQVANPSKVIENSHTNGNASPLNPPNKQRKSVIVSSSILSSNKELPEPSPVSSPLQLSISLPYLSLLHPLPLAFCPTFMFQISAEGAPSVFSNTFPLPSYAYSATTTQQIAQSSNLNSGSANNHAKNPNKSGSNNNANKKTDSQKKQQQQQMDENNNNNNNLNIQSVDTRLSCLSSARHPPIVRSLDSPECHPVPFSTLEHFSHGVSICASINDNDNLNQTLNSNAHALNSDDGLKNNSNQNNKHGHSINNLNNLKVVAQQEQASQNAILLNQSTTAANVGVSVSMKQTAIPIASPIHLLLENISFSCPPLPTQISITLLAVTKPHPTPVANATFNLTPMFINSSCGRSSMPRNHRGLFIVELMAPFRLSLWSRFNLGFNLGNPSDGYNSTFASAAVSGEINAAHYPQQQQQQMLTNGGKNSNGNANINGKNSSDGISRAQGQDYEVGGHDENKTRNGNEMNANNRISSLSNNLTSPTNPVNKQVLEIKSLQHHNNLSGSVKEAGSNRMIIRSKEFQKTVMNFKKAQFQSLDTNNNLEFNSNFNNNFNNNNTNYMKLGGVPNNIANSRGHGLSSSFNGVSSKVESTLKNIEASVYGSNGSYTSFGMADGNENHSGTSNKKKNLFLGLVAQLVVGIELQNSSQSHQNL